MIPNRVRQLLCLLTATAAHGIKTSAPTKVVDLGYATYQSNLEIDQGVTSFLGIRYAAPPTGNLRWQAPQLPPSISEVQNATTPPNQCWQQFLEGAMGQGLTNPFARPTSSARHPHRRLERSQETRDSEEIAGIGFVDEDCLFLDVHVPTTPTEESLPVIVYIHGGGYDAGNTTVYPTQDFVFNSDGGVIAVGIQYRLGVFGFLAGEEVKAAGSLNAGLLDQVFALEWVQAHISKFGGNPDQVTIYGQSAGAGSVFQHIVMNGGNTDPPLFRAAMMNSPFYPFQFPYNDPIPEAIFEEVVAQVGCANSTAKLDCLRQAEASSLLAADSNLGLSNFMGTYTFVPVIDDNLFTERLYVTLAKGQVNGDALIVSSMSAEGSIFTFNSTLVENNFTLIEYIANMFPRMTDSSVQQAVGMYTDIGLTSTFDQAVQVMGDAIFYCPAFASVQAFGSTGFKALMAIPPGNHALDLSYDFDTFAIPPTFNNSEFITSWQQAFLATAQNLNPNHLPTRIQTLTPTWPAWSSSHEEMLFNVSTENTPMIQTFATASGQISRCQFWVSQGDANGQ